MRSPRRLVEAVAAPLQAFFSLEAASGVLLLGCAVVALAWATAAPESYAATFALPLQVPLPGMDARFTLHALVNDGLMTLFFGVVGLEIKRELVDGELASARQALLPAVAAVGGMAVPAAIYAALNAGGPGAPGWGIPMATDIAFTIGVLTLLGSRVPRALVVFVTALAIFDDIGAILVIAIFYGSGVHPGWLAAAALAGAGAAAMGRARVGSAPAWAAACALLWWALHGAGIHATIAGVAIGLAVPTRSRGRTAGGEDPGAPLPRLERALHPWVAYGVMPAFALANSGVDLRAIDPARLGGAVAVGTALALVAGKTLGIAAFTLAAVRAGVAPMPGGASLAKLVGVSAIAGIGFTVAIFIAGLAFADAPALLDEAKVGILAGSLGAGLLGAAILRATSPVSPRP